MKHTKIESEINETNTESSIKGFNNSDLETHAVNYLKGLDDNSQTGEREDDKFTNFLDDFTYNR